MTVHAWQRTGVTGDMWIFLILFVVLLIIASAETHGIAQVNKIRAPRRMIVTCDGVELINPHRRVGVSSVGWENLARITVEPYGRGGARIEVYSHLSNRPTKPVIKVVTLSDVITHDEVQHCIDALQQGAA